MILYKKPNVVKGFIDPWRHNFFSEYINPINWIRVYSDDLEIHFFWKTDFFYYLFIGEMFIPHYI